MSVEVWAGMPHAFQFYSNLPEAKDSLARLGSFIKMRTVAMPASRKAAMEEGEKKDDKVKEEKAKEA